MCLKCFDIVAKHRKSNVNKPLVEQIFVMLTLQVVLCLYSLGRVTQKHPEYTGPAIGPKMAEKNERNFTEEQIR